MGGLGGGMAKVFTVFLFELSPCCLWLVVSACGCYRFENTLHPIKKEEVETEREEEGVGVGEGKTRRNVLAQT